LSSRQQNNRRLSDEDVIPDIELTTASEVDGRPFEDDEDVQSEEDKNKNKKIAYRRNYKVRIFFASYMFEFTILYRVLSVNMLAVQR
jgi:hypothetical protein